MQGQEVGSEESYRGCKTRRADSDQKLAVAQPTPRSYVLGAWPRKVNGSSTFSYVSDRVLYKEEQKCNMFHRGRAWPEDWMPLRQNINQRKPGLWCVRRYLEWYLHYKNKRAFASREYQGRLAKRMFSPYLDPRKWDLAWSLESSRIWKTEMQRETIP